jgi:hypothetical protein
MEMHMRLFRFGFAISVLLGLGLVVGCAEEKGKPMKDMQMGKDKPAQMDMKSNKGEKKPLPPEDVGPKAPPP